MNIFLPIFMYSITGAMFIPVFHSLIFYKSCLEYSTSENPLNCSDPRSAASRDARVHTRANTVILLSSTGLCLTGMISSYLVGRIGDRTSRKVGLLIPFTGLILADVSLIAQAHFIEISPLFFVASEVIFGLFGGYMSILSCAFAFVSSLEKVAEDRAKNIARMEGILSFGAMVGFLISTQLDRVQYVPMCVFFLAVHIAAVFSIVFLPSPDESKPTSDERPSLLGTPRLLQHKPLFSSNLVVLYAAFALSYFAFMGTTRILFFYLKQRFYWGAEKFGYLRAIVQAASTAMAFFVFPWLKTNGVRDVNLAVFGMISRSLGKFWYATAWNDVSVFFVVFFEMFAKFPASGIRSLIATNSEACDRGAAFAVVAAVEAACNLASSLFFHTIFPLSISSFPQISFVLMGILIVPAIAIVFIRRHQLEPRNVAVRDVRMASGEESVEEGEEVPTTSSAAS